MPNLKKMGAAQDQIERIEEAMRNTSNFTDGKTFFETDKGRELLSLAQLEELRKSAETRLISARNE